MKIVSKPLSELKPYWRNPRNNEAAVDAVVASIQEFGVCQPVLIDKDNVLIAGHTRYKAMQRLGITEAPCVVLELSPEKAREYRIIDNKTSEKATWDIDKLIPELRAFTDLQKFTVVFPDLKLPAIDMQIGSVSDKDVAQAVTSEADKFKAVVAQREAAIVTYTCPHCGEEFDVKA